jgi:hypothetical protein
MELYGKKARVIIEVETDAGDRLQFPINATFTPSLPTFGALGDSRDRSYGELRIPFKADWMGRVLDTLDEYAFTTGRD